MKLNWTKLLGFDLVRDQQENVRQGRLGSKLGLKLGGKIGTKAGVKTILR